MATTEGSEEPAEVEKRNVELDRSSQLEFFSSRTGFSAVGRSPLLSESAGSGSTSARGSAALSRSVFERCQSRLLKTITSGPVIRQSAVIAPVRRVSARRPSDAVRERFGSKAITRAVLLGRQDGFSPPLLPD